MRMKGELDTLVPRRAPCKGPLDMLSTALIPAMQSMAFAGHEYDDGMLVAGQQQQQE